MSQLFALLAEIGLIQVKEEGGTGFSESWQGCSEGFPEGEAQGKSRDAAFLKSIEGSVLALLNPYWPSGICIGAPESVLALLNSSWPS